MKNWILNGYLYPESQRYLFFYFLNRYLISGLGILFLMIIAFPLYHYIDDRVKISEQITLKQEHIEELKQQTARLELLKKNQQTQQQEHHLFNQVNPQIQRLLAKYQITTEQLHWQLDQEKHLYLTLNHHSQTIFHFLYEINQLEKLYPQEITLINLHQPPLVQLNAIFILLE